MIFPDQPEKIQEKLDTLKEELNRIHSEYELLESEDSFFRQFGSLFSKFKSEFVEILKRKVAFEQIGIPNDAEHAMARERLAGKYDQLVELQKFDNGVEQRMKLVLIRKANVLKEMDRLQGELRKQNEKRERKALNA